MSDIVAIDGDLVKDLLIKSVQTELSRLLHKATVEGEADPGASAMKLFNMLKHLTVAQDTRWLLSDVGLTSIFKILGETAWAFSSFDNISHSFFLQLYLHGGYQQETLHEVKSAVNGLVLEVTRSPSSLAVKISNAWSKTFHENYAVGLDSEKLQELLANFGWLSILVLMSVYQTTETFDNIIETIKGKQT